MTADFATNYFELTTLKLAGLAPIFGEYIRTTNLIRCYVELYPASNSPTIWRICAAEMSDCSLLE